MDEGLWVSREQLRLCLRSDETRGRFATGGNRCCLTEREREILSLLGQGLTNQIIADQLYISIHTVKTHLYKTFRKINVSNRLQAASWSMTHL